MPELEPPELEPAELDPDMNPPPASTGVQTVFVLHTSSLTSPFAPGQSSRSHDPAPLGQAAPPVWHFTAPPTAMQSLDDRQPPIGALAPTRQQTLPEAEQSMFDAQSSMPPPEQAAPTWHAVAFVVVSRQQTLPIPQVLGRHSPPDELADELAVEVEVAPVPVELAMVDVWLLPVVPLELPCTLDEELRLDASPSWLPLEPASPGETVEPPQ